MYTYNNEQYTLENDPYNFKVINYGGVYNFGPNELRQLRFLISLTETSELSEDNANNFFKLWFNDVLTVEHFLFLLDKILDLYNTIFVYSYRALDECDYDISLFTTCLIVQALNNSDFYEQARKDLFNDSVRILIKEYVLDHKV